MNKLLEEYVEEVRTGLRGLPEERRQSEADEITQHLEAAAAAYVELGLSRAEAEAEAVRRFGAASQVSAGLRGAWRRENRRFRDSLLGAFAVATLALVPAALVSAAGQAVPFLFDDRGGAHVFWFREVPLGLTIGAITALAAPKRAVAGALLAVLALCWFDLYQECLHLIDWTGPANPLIEQSRLAAYYGPGLFRLRWPVYIVTALLGAWWLRPRPAREGIIA